VIAEAGCTSSSIQFPLTLPELWLADSRTLGGLLFYGDRHNAIPVFYRAGFSIHYYPK